MILTNFKKTLGAGIALAAVLLMGTVMSSRSGRASNDNNNNGKNNNGNNNGNNNNGNNGLDEQAMISQGYAIAPVPLTLANKDHDLVGLGSYLVNAVADCNGCHNSDPNDSEFAGPNNPFFLMSPKGPYTGTAKVNPATYLAGGQVFGPFAPGSAPLISRNLTPDYRGLAEGGHSLSDFLLMIKTGADLDKIHPTCGPTVNTGCVPPPFNGTLLQVMPWPIFRNMTDRQLQAIYEYLSAIPCIDNTTMAPPPGFPDELRNNCTGK